MPVMCGPECYPCMERMIRAAVRMACGSDRECAVRTAQTAMRYLEDSVFLESPAPMLAADILRRIRAESGTWDPYAEEKRREFESSRAQFLRIRARFDDSLLSAVTLALLGNSLDFFKEPEQAMEEIGVMDPSRFFFYHNDVDALDAILRDRNLTVAYLTDNAGEIFFDGPLIRHMRDRGHRVVLAPKGGPALNDLTESDIHRLGIRADVVPTGVDAPGQDLEHSSPQFLRMLDTCHLIVSKGMANFETLYPHAGPQHVFYVFKAKCQRVAGYLRCPLNSYLALLDTPPPPVE